MSAFTHLLFHHFQFALIHGPNIPGSYAILLFTASDLASMTSHIHNWVLFLLWLRLFILSGVVSPLISSSILGTYWPGEFLFSVLSFCLFILFMGFSRQEHWSGLSFPSPVDHILSELSTMTRLSWVALHSMAHNFMSRQGCGPCDQIGYFSVTVVSVCLPPDALSQCLPSLLVFLWPWTWGISSRLLAAPALGII